MLCALTAYWISTPTCAGEWKRGRGDAPRGGVRSPWRKAARLRDVTLHRWLNAQVGDETAIRVRRPRSASGTIFRCWESTRRHRSPLRQSIARPELLFTCASVMDEPESVEWSGRGGRSATRPTVMYPKSLGSLLRKGRYRNFILVLD
jgi:hypothetical protein